MEDVRENLAPPTAAFSGRQCGKCGKWFRYESYRNLHKETYNGRPRSAVVVDRAAHMSFKMLQANDSGIYTTTGGNAF